jgi:dihydrolipoamide dehydrogenase
MHYDVIVIGGGPGGYTAAIRASELGARVAVVEEQSLGGTCLNRGCIPTKVYAHASSVIDDLAKAKDFGIMGQCTLDIDRLRSQKEKTVKTLVDGVGYLMRAHGIDAINRRAVFNDQNTIDAGEKYTADKFIIATGSKTFLPPIPGIDLEGVMTSDDALELTHIPESIVIIGAGIIGLEFAYIYNAFGSKVTIIEMLPEILPMLDRDVAGVLVKDITEKGIELILNSKVEGIDQDGKGLKVLYQKGTMKREVTGDNVLVAVGRTANLNGLEALNLNIGPKGIKVDSQMRTNIDNIFAIGDVTGTVQLAHFAANQGIIAAHNAMGRQMEEDIRVLPGCIYTNPEVAWVGLNEKQAGEQYGSIKTGIFPYRISGRALTMGERTGLIKVIIETGYNQILGMQIVGKNASELIHQGAIAIKNEFTINEITDMIHAHPTLSEGIKEICEHLSGMPINML